MAKNDFDIDFDFEKEYGFDPKAILDSEYTDDDLDLSQFDDEALGIDLGQESVSEFEDFDLDGLDLGEEEAEASYEPQPQPEEESEMDLSGIDFEDEEEEYPDDADLTADMAFTRRANFFGVDTGVLPQQPEFEQPAYQEPAYQETAYEEPAYEEPVQEPERYDEEIAEEREERRERQRLCAKHNGTQALLRAGGRFKRFAVTGCWHIGDADAGLYGWDDLGHIAHIA